jgi:hypothetical protein
MSEFGNFLDFSEPDNREFKTVLDDCVARYINGDAKYSIVYDLYTYILRQKKLEAVYDIFREDTRLVNSRFRIGNAWGMDCGRRAPVDFAKTVEIAHVTVNSKNITLGTMIGGGVPFPSVIYTNDYTGIDLDYDNRGGRSGKVGDNVIIYNEEADENYLYNVLNPNAFDVVDIKYDDEVGHTFDGQDAITAEVKFPIAPVANFADPVNLLYMSRNGFLEKLNAVPVPTSEIPVATDGTNPTFLENMRNCVQKYINWTIGGNLAYAVIELNGQRIAYCCHDNNTITNRYTPTPYFSCAHLKLLLKIMYDYPETAAKINPFLNSLRLSDDEIMSLIRTADTDVSLNKIGKYFSPRINVAVVADGNALKDLLGSLGVLYRIKKKSSISLLRGLGGFLVNINVNPDEPISWKDRDFFLCLMAQNVNIDFDYAKNIIEQYNTPEKYSKLCFLINRSPSKFNEKLTYGVLKKKAILIKGVNSIEFGTPTFLFNNFMGNPVPELDELTKIVRNPGAFNFVNKEVDFPMYSSTEEFAFNLIYKILSTISDGHAVMTEGVGADWKNNENVIKIANLVSELNRMEYNIFTGRLIKKDSTASKLISITPPAVNGKHYFKISLGKHMFWINIWYLVDRLKWGTPKIVSKSKYLLV